MLRKKRAAGKTEERRIRDESGRDKVIPREHEKVILKALTHYPELKDTPIVFRSKKRQSVPYKTAPVFSSLIKDKSEWKFSVEFLDQSDPPTEYALFKYLPEDAQVGVIGHELAHIVQYLLMTRLKILRTSVFLKSKSQRRKIERLADRIAIKHGLGEELLSHANYIRRIPGYTDERKDINELYLLPEEIKAAMKRTAVTKKKKRVSST